MLFVGDRRPAAIALLVCLAGCKAGGCVANASATASGRRRRRADRRFDTDSDVSPDSGIVFVDPVRSTDEVKAPCAARSRYYEEGATFQERA
jgi:hypothetical protein